MAQGNSDLIYVGYLDGNLLKTTNRGVTWTRIDTNSNELPPFPVTGIAVSPINNQHVALTYAGFNGKVVFISLDGGTTWSNRSPSFNLNALDVVWHPLTPGWLYIGTSFGVLASEDFGQTWSVEPLFSESEGPVITRVSQVFWQGNDSASTPYHLVAASYGRGMWRSNTPIYGKLYVDRAYAGVETGSFQQPFNTLTEAYNKASDGSTIVFKKDSVHRETPPTLLMKKQLTFEFLSNEVILK